MSSPLAFYIEVIEGLGFTDVAQAAHTDFGEDFPSRTLLLDLRGDKLQAYVKNMVRTGGGAPDPTFAEGLFALTDRERDVANMLLACSSNAEIASRLHVTEITVKKHLSRIYAKAKAKNKVEFLKKLMK